MINQSQVHGDWVDEIVDKYADMVFRIAFTHTKNRTDADDVFQEVFLKLCKSGIVFESTEHIKAWLIKVTISTSRKLFTSAWNKKVVELPRDLPHEDRDYTGVLDAVKSLPQKYRSVVYLFYFEDMPINEISKTLKVKESTIKSQLSRARNLLKGGFEDE